MAGPKHKKTLDRLIWRSRLKTLLQIGGISLIGVGLMFLPACRDELGPKSTIFSRIVILGAATFADPAIILIGVGLIVLGVSWLIPGELYEGP